MYLMLIELGIQFFQQYLSNLKSAKVPLETAQSIQAAIDALIAHKGDIISKANLDALRG